MRKVILLLTCLLSLHVMAQEEKLRLEFTVGSPMEFNVKDIKDISFVEDDNPLDILGEWFCYNEEGQAFESYDFHEDGTLGYFYYYISQKSGGTLNGIFEFQDDMLAMRLAGVTLFYPITAHSENSFVITSNDKSYTYYRIQKGYNMKTSDAPITIGNEGDVVIFVDNSVVGLENGKIKALQKGTGYALVEDASLNTIVAYRINVGYAPGSVVDWTQFFKKTKDEIVAAFGEPDGSRVDDSLGELVGYTKGYSPEISQLTFVFDKETGGLYMIQAVFRGVDEVNTYDNEIAKKYIRQDSGDDDKKQYYDSEDVLSRKVAIYVQKTSPIYINYIDLELNNK